MPDEKHYQRNPDFIFRKIVDESVLIPVHHDVADMDCFYTLNSVGAFIWEKLEEPVTQAMLQTALLDEYDTEPEELLADLVEFLDQMKAIGAVNEG